MQCKHCEKELPAGRKFWCADLCRDRARLVRRKTELNYLASLGIRRRTYRKRHPDRVLASQTAQQKQGKEIRDDFMGRLKDQACMDCGVKYPRACMEFDHRPGTTKEFALSQVKLLTRPTILKVVRELKKCDLVCANCHRIRTEARR